MAAGYRADIYSCTLVFPRPVCLALINSGKSLFGGELVVGPLDTAAGRTTVLRAQAAGKVVPEFSVPSCSIDESLLPIMSITT